MSFRYLCHSLKVDFIKQAVVPQAATTLEAMMAKADRDEANKVRRVKIAQYLVRTEQIEIDNVTGLAVKV